EQSGKCGKPRAGAAAWFGGCTCQTPEATEASLLEQIPSVPEFGPRPARTARLEDAPVASKILMDQANDQSQLPAHGGEASQLQQPSLLGLLPSQGKQRVLAAHEERAAGDGRRCHAHIVQLVDGEQLELRTSPYHAHLALLRGEVQPTVRRHRR